MFNQIQQARQCRQMKKVSRYKARLEQYEEAYDFFKADYLRQQDVAIAECYLRLVKVAEKEGWQVPTLLEVKEWVEKPLTLKSCKIERRRFQQ
ncbi:DNA-binding domain-containing protein [Lonepinella koalarum]|uniref:DNA-binding domain-containing protein n=1 Tax=Lonepinella koalarum TaxID=53417 RepID=UPI0010514304|nr:DNA-binding domain-containing protein [Lonepinella koalarum]MDH2927325.1 hypothetical protein [Lonepinella koalarum]TFJ88799.1 hypothetical protein E0709_11750 [Lonepinella koalarum]